MENNQLPRVHTSGKTFIKPGRHIEPTRFRCSAVENLCARVFHSMALFFPLRDDADMDRILSDLKQGLSLLMNEHPILVGILRQDARGDFGVEVLPKSQSGGYFHFSDVSNDSGFPSFQELQDRGFPYLDADHDGLRPFRPEPFPTSEDGQPVFAVKISRVRGGLVWTASLSHLITDLVLGMTLISRWAHWTKTVNEANGKPVPIPKAVPWADRERLMPDPGPPLDTAGIRAYNKTKIGIYKLLDPTYPEQVVHDLTHLMTKADVSEAKPDQLDYFNEATSGIWRFTPAKLGALVDAVNSVDPSIRLSRFQVLTAFAWQRYRLAKLGDKPKNEPETSQIMTALNVRGKLNPPLHQYFLGAAVDLVNVKVDRAVMQPKKDQKEQWKSISDIAKKIRECGSQWKEANFMEMLRLSQRTPISPGLVPEGPFDALVTDHALFTLGLKSDWGGEMGFAVTMREPYICRETPQGEIIILPKQPNGDQDIMISAERIVLERLLTDKVMAAASDNVCVRHNVVESFEMTRAKPRAKL